MSEPLAFIVMMEGEPIDEAFMFDNTEEPRFPVVAQVVVGQRKSSRAPRQDPDLVPTDVAMKNADVSAALDTDGYARTGVGVGFRIGSLNRHTGQVHSNIVAAYGDGGGVNRRGRLQAIGARLHAHGGCQDQTRMELDGGCDYPFRAFDMGGWLGIAEAGGTENGGYR